MNYHPENMKTRKRAKYLETKNLTKNFFINKISLPDEVDLTMWSLIFY